MTAFRSTPFDRRQLLKAAALTPFAGLALSGCAAKPAESAAANKTVTVTSYGGSYNDQLTQTILDPFSKQSGIQTTLLANTSLAALKAQVQSGDVQWDLVEITAPEYEVAVAEGLLEKFDYDIISDKGLPGYAKAEYGIKYLSFLFVMAWDQKVISDAQAPKDWAQFFDQGKYNTKRSVYNQLSDSSVLEAALSGPGPNPPAGPPSPEALEHDRVQGGGSARSTVPVSS